VVHVAHARARGQSTPGRRRASLEQARVVDRQRRHRQLAAALRPRLARPVRVHLHGDAVGILEVDGLAHQVIRVRVVDPHPLEVRDEAAELGAARQQERVVVDPRPPALGHRTRPRVLAQLHEWRAVGTAPGAVAPGLAERAHAEHACEPLAAPPRIGDAQAHRAQSDVLGQSGGRHAISP
jgi:hypothetical protein